MDVILWLRRQLMEILIDGLNTDGAHHKQYHLEQALKLVVLPGEFEEIKADHGWEAGISG